VDRADELAGEVMAEWRATGFAISGSDSEWLSDLVVALPFLDRQSEFLEATSQAMKIPNPWREAAAAYASGDFRRAAEVYEGIGARPEEAYARLRAAESFVREGRRAEADAELQSAVAFWRSVGATAYVREGEALLAESA
jgi:hypothetical protein